MSPSSRASRLPPHPHPILFPVPPATHVPTRPPRPPSLAPRCALPGLSSSNRPPTDLLAPAHSCHHLRVPGPQSHPVHRRRPLPSEEVDEHHRPARWGWRYRIAGCSSSRPSHTTRSMGAPYSEDLVPPRTPYPYSASA
jgi:hypothetical protein